jgi:hypothetical protein
VGAVEGGIIFVDHCAILRSRSRCINGTRLAERRFAPSLSLLPP